MLLHRHKTLVYDDIFRSDTGFDFGVCLHLDFLIFITFFVVQTNAGQDFFLSYNMDWF